MTDTEKFGYIMTRAKEFLLLLDINNYSDVDRDTFFYEMLLLRDEGISSEGDYKMALIVWLVELMPPHVRTKEEMHICGELRLL